MQNETNKKLNEKYMLRCVAGDYLLIDMEQNGLKFIPPVMFNETGADVWKFYCESESIDETVKKIQNEYGIDETTSREAVLSFLEGIKEQGIDYENCR